MVAQHVRRAGVHMLLTQWSDLVSCRLGDSMTLCLAQLDDINRRRLDPLRCESSLCRFTATCRQIIQHVGDVLLTQVERLQSQSNTRDISVHEHSQSAAPQVKESSGCGAHPHRRPLHTLTVTSVSSCPSSAPHRCAVFFHAKVINNVSVFP